MNVQKTEQKLENYFLGKSPYDIYKHIVKKNNTITNVFFRLYKPLTTKGRNPPAKNEKVLELTRDEFLNDLLVKKFDLSNPNFFLGIESKLKTKQKNLYMQLLDFRIVKRPTSVKLITKTLKKLLKPRFGPGVIIETKHSYHYIGFKLLEYDKWLDFMSWSLLTKKPGINKNYAELVDVGYVGYSLLKRSGNLRILLENSDFNPKCVRTI